MLRKLPSLGTSVGTAIHAAKQSGSYFGQAMRMMVGVPDYGQYVAHARAMHPDVEPLSYEAFFRNRQEARYGRGKAGCC